MYFLMRKNTIYLTPLVLAKGAKNMFAKNDDGKLHEECAIFGVSLNEEFSEYEEAPGITYNALLALQHRGQEGAGIALSVGNSIFCKKDMGLVSEVFTPDVMADLPGSKTAVGHARYSVTGEHSKANVQPFVTEFLVGRIATVHNGNVTNAKDIRDKLEGFGMDFTATSDSEVISSLVAYRLIRDGNLFEGVKEAASSLEGAFSLIILGTDNSLVAVRDPNGYRPLCIGENKYGLAVASESCALDSCGFKFIRDIEPGEIVVIQDGEIVASEIALKSKQESLCVFEYVYFARTDSVIDDLSVYEARVNMGKMLAKEHPVDADIVCGVPDSGLEAALGYAEGSGLPLATGFVKNRYIGRSFIFPTQAQRDDAVKIKINPLAASVKGKRVVLVDDSIVRGTTSAKIIDVMRNAGAKEVHMRVSSPPFKHMCYFGTDIDDEKNLIANQMSIDDICKKIGADSLGYISPDGLLKSCEKSKRGLCTACFTGEYKTDIVDYTKIYLGK